MRLLGLVGRLAWTPKDGVAMAPAAVEVVQMGEYVDEGANVVASACGNGVDDDERFMTP